MASSRKDLEELHALITKSFKTRITADLEDNIPTDAATLSGAVKFLKDNAVTADPANTDDLTELRDKLTEAAKKRRNVLALVDKDVKEANG
jgi:uncharacterized protein YggE